MNARTLCLALLQRCPMSGYEIRKLVADGVVSHFTEASYGSIYPALDRLEAEGLVTGREERAPGKPPRRVYDITAKGSAAFIAALHEPVQPDVFRSDFLLVAANAPLVEPEHLTRLIEERLERDRADLAQLEMKLTKLGTTTDPIRAAARWTLEYGQHMVQASIAFLEDHRARIEGLASQAPRSEAISTARAAGPADDTGDPCVL